MSGELIVFMGAVYGGMVTGVVYLVFHALNLMVKRRFLHAALDALFYIVAAGVVFVTLVYINGGVLRVHIIFGLLLGFAAAVRGILGVFKLMKIKRHLR